MLTAINSFLKIVPPILLAGTILLLGFAVVAQTARLSAALKDSATYEVNAANAIAANAQQYKLIEQFKTDNKNCLANWQRAKVAAGNSARQLADFKEKIKLQSKIAEAPEEALKNADCQTLLQTDITSACPALAGSLYRREALYYGD